MSVGYGAGVGNVWAMEDRAGRGIRSRDPLDQRLDQWVETGRQFVDGVSGRRPGQRRGSVALDSVGRWVGEKVEWLLEDDDDWREPWQDIDRSSVSPPARSQSRSVDRSQVRRPLDAISRRGRPVSSQQPASGMDVRPDDNDQSWPEDDSFRVQRWERSRAESGEPQAGPGRSRPSARRSLPRSSRRRD